MMLGMNIGKCQLSKLYAYNALLFTSGRRIENNALLSDERIIVIDNPESIVPDVDIITVTDDGTDNPIRKYTRVETKADIKITEFDGEGLISKRLSNSLDSIHSSYQIRMPYIKGVVHEVDFASLFDELCVTEITDIFGNKHNPHDVDLIINKSMFKGYGWMLENNLTWAESFDVIINKIKASKDAEERFALMHQAEDILMSTGAICPLYFYTDQFMCSTSIEGSFVSPLGYKYFMYASVAE
jgi:hypothetical protein